MRLGRQLALQCHGLLLHLLQCLLQLLLLGLEFLQLLHQRMLLLLHAALGIDGLRQEAADGLQAAADDAAQ